MSVQFILDLIDKTSGPATAAASALAKVEGKLKGLQRAGKLKLDKIIGGERPRDEIGRFIKGANRGGLKGLGDDLGKIGEQLSGFKDKAMALAPAALIVGGIAVAGAAYAGKMAAFKEDALFAFTTMEGTQEKGLALFTMADNMARSMGVKTTDVVTSLRELMGSGFDANTSKAIVAAQMDIKAFNPAAELGELNKALAKMAGAQKFSMEVAESILGAGVDDTVFYEKLQKISGSKSRDDLMKKISAGKVTDQMGLQAMLESVQQKSGGGDLGSLAAKKATTTTSGAIANAEAMFERLFMAIQTGQIGASLAELASVAAKMFDPAQPGGQRLLSLIDRIITTATEFFKGFSGDDLASTFDTVSSAIGAVLDVLQPVVSGFTTGFRDAYSTVRELMTTMGLGASTSAGLGDALKLIATAAGYAVVGIGAVVGGLFWLLQSVVMVPLRIAAFAVGALVSVGGFLIDGLTMGWDAAKQKFIDRVTALAQLLPAKFRQLLGIQSPSRVMAEIGGYTMQGFEQGIEQGPSPTAAISDRLVPALSLSAVVGRTGSASAAASPTIHLSVQVDGAGAGSAEALGEEIAQRVRRELDAIFASMALQTGAT